MHASLNTYVNNNKKYPSSINVNPRNLSFKLKVRAFFQKKKKKKNYQARQVFIICDFHISFLCFFKVKKATIDGQL
jgi:hypothetical protein